MTRPVNKVDSVSEVDSRCCICICTFQFNFEYEVQKEVSTRKGGYHYPE